MPRADENTPSVLVGLKVGFPQGREVSQRDSIVKGIPSLESGIETIENEADPGLAPDAG